MDTLVKMLATNDNSSFFVLLAIAMFVLAERIVHYLVEWRKISTHGPIEEYFKHLAESMADMNKAQQSTAEAVRDVAYIVQTIKQDTAVLLDRKP